MSLRSNCYPYMENTELDFYPRSTPGRLRNQNKKHKFKIQDESIEKSS